MITIRTASVGDVFEVRKLFRETILTVNLKDYTYEEAADWASNGENDKRWEDLMMQTYFLVAVKENFGIVGFSSVSADGYIHFLFTHKDFQNRGIALALCERLEIYVRENKVPEITSEVSITARPFFEKRGYKVDKEQKRKARFLFLTNYIMSKKI